MKGIIFSTEMIRKIISCDKTMTRRPIKPQPIGAEFLGRIINPSDKRTLNKMAFGDERHITDRYKPRYDIGDMVYVRETWADYSNEEDRKNGEPIYIYKAAWGDDVSTGYWRPSIYMPKEAARIFLKVTSDKVERLQDISEEDAMAEGVMKEVPGVIKYGNYKAAFMALWNDIYRKKPEYMWDSNCWVWAITFERIEKPVNEEIS